MQAILSGLFDPSALSPHGFCLLWEPGLIWLHAVSDAVIGLSYFSIPLALLYFVRRRPDLEFGWILWLFAAFILACGTTHFMAIITLWIPVYWLDGMIKLLTAMISLTTAVLLWPLIPQALTFPSPRTLGLVNEELSRQIQERDRNAAALQISEAKLRQSQKMEALGRLTGGIAHDFNNTLTIISGNLELLQRRLKPQGDRLLRLVEQAMAGAQHAASLTHQLLAFSRKQPLAPRALDANQLISGMSELLRRTLGEPYSLETELDGDLWQTRADANQLESALLNLALNARDAMPEGGRLTIATANVTLEAGHGEADESDLAKGQYVLIAMTDTGTGMPSEVVVQAFEPFFTTKPPGIGTGLGLSQVYGFVKQTGGHVVIDSEVGRGTTVKMFFPRAAAAAETDAAAPPRETSPAMGRGETILLVEDDPNVRDFTSASLSELNYVVLEADSASPALEILRSRQPIDLLMTDVVLPGIDGRKLADEATRLRPALRVLFISGYTSDVMTHNGVLDPGVHLLSKPFTMAQIASAVRVELDCPAPADKV